MISKRSENQKPIYIVIGTRAQLIKMAPIMQLLEQEKIKYNFIYTEQHKETIDNLISNFEIKTPYRNIINQNSEAKSLKSFSGWSLRMLLKLINPFSRKHILNSGRGIILTHGDTATTAWAAIYGKTSFCKVVHVESGLRSFNILNPFPEEIMRLITFTFSDYYLCPNDWAVKNLRYFPGKKINIGANTMYDSLNYAIQEVKGKSKSDIGKKIEAFNLPKKFCLVSIHRAENLFNEVKFKKLIDILFSISKEIDLVIVLHPVTKEHLRKTGTLQRLSANKKFYLIDRQDFFTFVAITQKAQFMITDGGSNQEEMSYIGKPTLIMRSATERTEGLSQNAVLSKFDPEIIKSFIASYHKYKIKPEQIISSPSKKAIEFIKSIAYEK